MTVTNLDVAREIQAQIGNRAFVMMGARNFVGGPASLSFRVGSGARYKGQTINVVQITLDPSDTYTVRFYYMRGSDRTLRVEVDDVYFDSLHDILSKYTGFRLSL